MLDIEQTSFLLGPWSKKNWKMFLSERENEMTNFHQALFLTHNVYMALHILT